MTSWNPTGISSFLGQASHAITGFVSHIVWGEEQRPPNLDVLQVLLKLCILAYKPSGTIIRIKNDQIELVEPKEQSWWDRQDESCISYLKQPLEIARAEMNPTQDPHLRRIFETALSGLNRLKEGCKPIFAHAIEAYKVPLQEALQGIGCPDRTQIAYPNGWTPRVVEILDLCLQEAQERRHPEESEAIARAIGLILTKKTSSEPIDERQVEAAMGGSLKLSFSQGRLLPCPSFHENKVPETPHAPPDDGWWKSAQYESWMQHNELEGVAEEEEPPPPEDPQQPPGSDEQWEEIPIEQAFRKEEPKPAPTDLYARLALRDREMGYNRSFGPFDPPFQK